MIRPICCSLARFRPISANRRALRVSRRSLTQQREQCALMRKERGERIHQVMPVGFPTAASLTIGPAIRRVLPISARERRKAPQRFRFDMLVREDQGNAVAVHIHGDPIVFKSRTPQVRRKIRSFTAKIVKTIASHAFGQKEPNSRTFRCNKAPWFNLLCRARRQGQRPDYDREHHVDRFRNNEFHCYGHRTPEVRRYTFPDRRLNASSRDKNKISFGITTNEPMKPSRVVWAVVLTSPELKP